MRHNNVAMVMDLVRANADVNQIEKVAIYILLLTHRTSVADAVYMKCVCVRVCAGRIVSSNDVL